MEKLRKQLDDLLASLPEGPEVKARLKALVSVDPFSEFEYIISTSLGANVLSLEDYYKLRGEYIARNKNSNRYLFELSAPTAFGITWAEQHIQKYVPELSKPPKKSKKYDFMLDNSIRVEVKASRAVAYRTKGRLIEKALESNSLKQFDMNFQQLKPGYCDVFVWIGVWLDAIRYWVLTAQEVRSLQGLGKQHAKSRGEWQFHVRRENLPRFDKFETRLSELLSSIRSAYVRLATV